MAEYNDEDLKVAFEILNPWAYYSFRPRGPFYVDDVYDSFAEFDEDAGFVTAEKLPGLPAITNVFDGIPVTIGIREFFPDLGRLAYMSRWRQSLSDKLDRIGGTFVQIGHAREAILQLAALFIASRIAGNRELTASGSPTLSLAGQTTPGCAFSVHTVSKGLRVHWSGAYRISGNFFGHPTSPTSSTLQSGVYVFGVDGGAYTSTQWDTATKVTLPGPHTSIKLNF